ncbi:hypothetical protein RHECNPAF_430042 [Rhizobium etli CNPAF512]|nr:hypothetical protein RHECNPAF_430042 [Rhizobium etli CNPAF512]
MPPNGNRLTFWSKNIRDPHIFSLPSFVATTRQGNTREGTARTKFDDPGMSRPRKWATEFNFEE